MSLKTLHLTNAWHATSGGIGTFYRSLLRAANEVGHQLRLLVPAEQDRVEEVGEYGRIYHLRSAHAPLNRSYRMIYPPHYLRKRGQLRDILNSEQPDLIEICDKYTLPYLGGLLRIKKLSGVDLHCPILGLSCERMDENMLAYVSRSPLGKRFCRWYMKNIYFPQFDHHVANSLHTAEELREASRGHKIRRGVWVRPMGVDASRFSPSLRSESLRQTLAASAGGGSDSILLLYAGRLVPEKNLDLLAKTLGALMTRRRRDYRLLIAGQGMSRDSLAAACESISPGHTLFLDHLSDRAELARVYASADIFVHPNPREPFGIAPLEAMASGLPLVAPNVGGITSYSSAANAWLVPPEAPLFADAVESVLDERELRDRRVRSALETAARYDWKFISRDFIQFYREMVTYFRDPGAGPARPPLFYSTLGDYWGREIEGANSRSEERAHTTPG
jgi:alpha-1,6-mannosyltransferase